MHPIEAKGLLSAENGMNLYRGCTHGCIYCDSRSRCYQMDHLFEDVAYKVNAPRLLDEALKKKRSRCMIATGSMSDPYLPLEKELRLTRTCLEIIERRGFGLTILTKSASILRDLDLLAAIHKNARCVAQMTLTTFDETLCRIVEPHVSTTRERLAALAALRDAGVPTLVWLSPLLPFINDTEENVLGIVRACADAGVGAILCFGIGMTLRDGNREYFYAQLGRHFPGLRERYIRTYGNAYMVGSPNHARLMRVLSNECARLGIRLGGADLFTYLHEFPEKKSAEQLSLFDA